jgi:hypothetical protein
MGVANHSLGDVESSPELTCALAAKTHYNSILFLCKREPHEPNPHQQPISHKKCLQIFLNIRYTEYNGKIDWEGCVKKATVVYFKVALKHMPGGTEEYHEALQSGESASRLKSQTSSI